MTSASQNPLHGGIVGVSPNITSSLVHLRRSEQEDSIREPQTFSIGGPPPTHTTGKRQEQEKWCADPKAIYKYSTPVQDGRSSRNGNSQSYGKSSGSRTPPRVDRKNE